MQSDYILNTEKSINIGHIKIKLLKSDNTSFIIIAKCRHL